MSAGLIAVIVIVGIAIVFVLWLVGMYNGLVRARIRVKEAWSGIDVQLRRRASLIPNLVPLILSAGLMGFLGISLNAGTAMTIGIAFGRRLLFFGDADSCRLFGRAIPGDLTRMTGRFVTNAVRVCGGCLRQW